LIVLAWDAVAGAASYQIFPNLKNFAGRLAFV